MPRPIPVSELDALRAALREQELAYAWRWLTKDGLLPGAYEDMARRSPRVALALGLECFAEYLEARAIADRAIRAERLAELELGVETWAQVRAMVREDDVELIESFLDRLANVELRFSDDAEPSDDSGRVRHPKFGLGSVIERANDNVVVRFDDGTERRLRRSFLEPAD